MPSRTHLVLLLGLVLAGPVRAAGDEPERLLPATTQLYVRWDGVEAHREAYRRSAFGRMLAGEVGRTARSFWAGVEREAKIQEVGDKLLDGAAPEELCRADANVKALLALPRLVGATGLVLGFEARLIPTGSDAFRRVVRLAAGKSDAQELVTPQVQLTVVFPGAADLPETANLLKRLTPVKTVEVDGRSFGVHAGGPAGWQWAWWLEGKHLVVAGCLGDVTRAVWRVLHAGLGLTRHPLYSPVRDFRDFEVTTRGFLDVKGLTEGLRWLLLADPVLGAVVAETGLFDLHDLRFWEGFEGDESRSVWEARIGPRRRGLTSLLVPGPLRLKDLPSVPADAQRWTAGRANVAALYDVLLTLLTLSGGDRPKVGLLGNPAAALAEAKRQMQREIDDELGVRLQDDVFGALGDTFLTYSSPGDGLFVLGQVMAVSVKDEARLARALDALGGRLASLAGDALRLRKRPFRGAVIREFTVPGGGSPVTVSYTVHNGWLVLAAQPQPVQGFVLLSKGEVPAWKPDRRTARALTKVPGEAGLVQVVDPRPTVKLLLSSAPLVAGLTGSEKGRRLLEPGDLPHAGAVASHLFPNVSWTRFDGEVFRVESRESLWLPLQEVGLEWLPLLAGIR